MTDVLTRRELIARGIPARTASRWIAEAVREKRAVRVPVAIGNGATRLAWAMTLVREQAVSTVATSTVATIGAGAVAALTAEAA